MTEPIVTHAIHLNLVSSYTSTYHTNVGFIVYLIPMKTMFEPSNFYIFDDESRPNPFT